MNTTYYVGFAGDTDPGRFLSAGLWRSRDGGAWERAETGFPRSPQTFALLADPRRPGEVFAGTQDGIFKSADFGDSWAKLDAPEPGIAVWSLARHPGEPEILFAGYEPTVVCMSTDNGRTWRDLKIEVDYPAITRGPEMPKRITRLAIDPIDTDCLYGTIEIGGLIMSEDGGRTWRQMLDGLYSVEDAVDLHSAVVHASGAVSVATRVGCFQSSDHGRHWKMLPVPRLREKGSYCRVLGLGPGNTLYVGGGNDFDGEIGGFFYSPDGGENFSRCDLGAVVKSSIFAMAVHPVVPERVVCSDKFGNVFATRNAGESWSPYPLPKGLGHVFSIALG